MPSKQIAQQGINSTRARIHGEQIGDGGECGIGDFPVPGLPVPDASTFGAA